jgi:hypothetical protein
LSELRRSAICGNYRKTGEKEQRTGKKGRSAIFRNYKRQTTKNRRRRRIRK